MRVSSGCSGEIPESGVSPVAQRPVPHDSRRWRPGIGWCRTGAKNISRRPQSAPISTGPVLSPLSRLLIPASRRARIRADPFAYQDTITRLNQSLDRDIAGSHSQTIPESRASTSPSMFEDISKPPRPLPTPQLETLRPGLSLLPPLLRKGDQGPGLIILCPDSESTDGPVSIAEGVPSPLLKWAEEGYTVVEICLSALSGSTPASDVLGDAVAALAQCQKCAPQGKVGLVCKWRLSQLTPEKECNSALPVRVAYCPSQHTPLPHGAWSHQYWKSSPSSPRLSPTSTHQTRMPSQRRRPHSGTSPAPRALIRPGAPASQSITTPR